MSDFIGGEGSKKNCSFPNRVYVYHHFST